MLAWTWLALAADSTLAQEKQQPEPKANQIRIEYVGPKNKALNSVFELVKEQKVLENVQDALAPLRFPEPLLMRFQDCDGADNAWYENKIVTVCYEYIAEVLRHAAASNVSREDAIAGPAAEVVLHEAAHAVFDMLKIPVLGRAEDAADTFAAYVLLNLGKENARRAMRAIAIMYYREAKEETKPGKPRSRTVFADEHGLAAQRFYNLLCIAYGGYPDLFQVVIEKGYLPKERSEGCGAEYRQLDHALKRLLAPHLDAALVQEGRHRFWREPPRAVQ